ncbi:MAG: DNA alkylation repair protein [Microscillaceae bacterium]|nr:DNA alkylation repair protein [Microscillaceae bacterium]
MAELLKNIFYQKHFFDKLTTQIKNHYPNFDTPYFYHLLYDEIWESLELKERMRHTTLCLGKTLPESYKAACEIIQAIAPEFRDLDAMVFPDFVEVYGLEEYDLSMQMLGFLTGFSSSEFAIRPFIKKYPEQTLQQMRLWAEDENHHVRRFASEGCRPRLPWAMALPALKTDPSPILPILEKLKADESEYVRRSVANNLNDISKDHPKLLVEIARNWYDQNTHTDWILKHGCRTLLKKGNPEVLQLFGFGDTSFFVLEKLQIKPVEVKIGEELEFLFELKVNRPGKIRLEYVIDFVKSNGKSTSKIFHISEKNHLENENKIFQKTLSFKNLTTRKHYPGRHRLAIIANGVEMLFEYFSVI